MDLHKLATLMVILAVVVPLSGCTEPANSSSSALTGEKLVEIENPCMVPTNSSSQSMISLMVDEVERFFRLSVPSSEAGTKLPLIIAYHGGGDAEEDFSQQNEFDQLGEQEKFIMAYAIAESDRTPSEGDWFLNTCLLYTSPSPRD